MSMKGSMTMISKIGPYIVDRELSKGGMGVAYTARREEAEETIVLKVIRPELAMDMNVRTSFLREIENSFVLDHPNVIAIHEAGSVDAIDEAGEPRQVLYYTMEYCDQGSLHDRLKIDGPLPVEPAIDLILQALEGLDYAHHVALPVQTADGRIVRARGLVHRDIKPQNLFLRGGDDGVIVKIGDFGLAKAFETTGISGRTRTGTMAGTPEFMPRQQAINYKYAKQEVDVWAIAASLYFMLTGAFPRNFTGRDPWGIVLNEHAVPIRERNPSIPSRYAEVIDAALVDSPTIPVQTAQQFKAMLEGIR
jgi:eukaryotic-like serine/threonine-protein kinase